MNQNILSDKGFESTYALLVRSEERERGMFEGVAYLIFILSAIFSIWHLAQQPIELPKDSVIHTTTTAQYPTTQQT
jgi:hypothetical protein